MVESEVRTLKLKLSDKGYKLVKETKTRLYFCDYRSKYYYDKASKTIKVQNVADTLRNKFLLLQVVEKLGAVDSKTAKYTIRGD